MFTTAKQALTSKSFFGQLTITIVINFGINFGFGWASYSNWGKHQSRNSWPGVQVWVMNGETNSCLALDIMMTCFFIGFFCMLAGSNGAQKDVREKKCDILDTRVTTRGIWRFTPVRVPNILLRSLVNGAYFMLVAGVPMILVMWMGVRNTTMPGFAWVMLKGFWAAAVSGFVFVIVFMSAIDQRNFPEIEFQSLGLAGKPGETDASPIPLVGNVAHV